MKIVNLFNNQGRELLVQKALDRANNILPDRIARETNSSFYGFQELDTLPSSRLQSIDDMILEIASLKAAIVRSNNSTVIRVGNKDMTIAEAIIFRDSISPMFNSINSTLSRQLAIKNSREEASYQETLKDFKLEDANLTDDLKTLIETKSLKNKYENDLNIEKTLKTRLEQLEDFVNGELHNAITLSNLTTILTY